MKNTKLIYFSYPILDFNQSPCWCDHIKDLLVNKYNCVVYDPLYGCTYPEKIDDNIYKTSFINDRLNEVGKDNYTFIKRLYPYHGERVEGGYDDNDIIVKDLRHLISSDLILADLNERSHTGRTVELIIGKYMKKPLIGVLDRGMVSVWALQLVDIIINSRFNANQIKTILGTLQHEVNDVI